MNASPLTSSRQDWPRLLGAAFVSQIGSHLMTLAVAAFVHRQTGSPVQAAWVFVFALFPPVLVSNPLGRWIDRALSRRLWIGNELLAGFISLLCGLCISSKQTWLLYITLSLRSIVGFCGRACANKWIKLITPPEAQTNRLKLFFLTFYLSTAGAGVLAAYTLAQSSIWVLVEVDVITYLLGIVLLATLQPIATTMVSAEAPRSKKNSLGNLWQQLAHKPLLGLSFALVCGLQGLFQSAYCVLVTQLPMHHFSNTPTSIGAFQIAASLGILCGFGVNWFFPTSLQRNKVALGVGAVGLSCLWLTVQFAHHNKQWLSLLGFGTMNFFFEWLWLFYTARFFQQSPTGQVALYQFVLSSTASFLMSLGILAYAYGIQLWGTQHGVQVVSAFLLLCSLLGIFVRSLYSRQYSI